jgi:hypothetical protein
MQHAIDISDRDATRTDLHQGKISYYLRLLFAQWTMQQEKLGIYKDDGRTWLKIKNRSYSQAEGRHELLTRRK